MFFGTTADVRSWAKRTLATVANSQNGRLWNDSLWRAKRTFGALEFSLSVNYSIETRSLAK